MRFLFVWTGVTSYMADCWRELQSRPGVYVRVVIVEKEAPETAFRLEFVLRDLDYRLVSERAYERESLFQFAVEFDADVVFVVGWRSPVCRDFVWSTELAKTSKILVFDLPFRWTLKKVLAPVLLYLYLKRFEGCFVPGEKAAEYARWLGFSEVQIVRGLFSVLPVKQGSGKSPSKGFLFAGRYVAEKRLDLLLEAYRIYRNSVGEPWPLTCCGTGPFKWIFSGQEGVTDLGFQQPEELAELRRQSGAFVLCSDFDPWPLVLAEACVVGLPLICTDKCGNHVELVKNNGFVCRSGHVDEMVIAMVKMHRMSNDERSRMAELGRQLVQPYICGSWADRVVKSFGEGRL